MRQACNPHGCHQRPTRAPCGRGDFPGSVTASTMTSAPSGTPSRLFRSPTRSSHPTTSFRPAAKGRLGKRNRSPCGDSDVHRAESRSPTIPPAIDPFAGAQPDQVGLELRDHRQHVEQQPTDRVVGVVDRGAETQTDVPGGEFSAIARASGSDRARRLSLVTTRASPSRQAAIASRRPAGLGWCRSGRDRRRSWPATLPSAVRPSGR